MSNIKINDVPQRIQYMATGGQTQFTVPFPFFQNNYIYVWLNGVQLFMGGAPGQYTVTGAGSPSGGLVTFNTATILNDIVTIEGIMPIDRTSIYSATISNLTGSDLNGDFNREVVMLQQLNTVQSFLQLQYAPWALVSQDLSVTTDRYIPILPALGAWRKDATDTFMEYFLTPDSPGLAPSDAVYILQTANSNLPDAIALDELTSGFLFNVASAGLSGVREFEAEPNQLVVTNADGMGGNPVYGIADNAIIPGTAGMGIPAGTTAQRVTPTPPSIGFRFNTDLQQPEAYIGGQWVAIPSAAAGLFLPLAGGTMTGDILMDGHIIDGLPLPLTNNEAASKIYVDNAVGGAAGGITGNIQWNNGGAFAGDPNFNTDGAGNVGITGSFEIDNVLVNANRISATTGLLELEDAQLFNALDANSNKIENLAICTVGTDAANKDYVDATAAGRYFVAPVRAASTTPVAGTYVNGASGIGATFSPAANGFAALDGVTLNLNDRVAFWFQTSSLENGIYFVSDIGGVSSRAEYTRALDYDQPSEIDPGDTVGITEGTLYEGSFLMQTAVVTTIGTDPITFILSLNPNVVTIGGTQTITGDKTFSGLINVPAPTLPASAINKEYLEGIVGGGHIAKNLIIGGNFDTNPWQRGTTFAATGGGAFSADRFALSGTTTAVITAQKTLDSPTPAQAGMLSNYCLELLVTTAQASIGAGNSLQLQQKIEGYNFAQIAQVPFVLSFWVKSNVTGTFCVFFGNSTPDRSYVSNYTINAANTWEKKTITVSASPSAGTWDYTNGIGLRVGFSIAAGTTFQTTANTWQTGAFFATSSQANGLSAINNYFRFALIQVENGSTATPFEIKSAQEVLASCQRYYFKTFPLATPPAQASGTTANTLCYRTPIGGTSTTGAQISFPPMRTTPTMVAYNPVSANATWRNTSLSTDSGTAVPVVNTVGYTGVYIQNTQLVGDTVTSLMTVHLTASAEI